MASRTQDISDRTERRLEPRLRLLAAANALLNRGRAFSEISVEDLTTEAELSRTTFYDHFEDKSALLMQLGDHVTSLFEGAASRWYRLPRTATREDLHAALEDLTRAHIEHRATMSAVVDAAAYDPRIRAGYQSVIAVRIAEMERSFREQQQHGAVRADIDIAQVTPWVAWMVERTPFRLLRDGPDALETHLEGLTTVLWRTLYEGTR